MWQQAVVIYALLLFKTKAHFVRSANYNNKDTFPIIVEALDNGIMKKVRLKSDESDSWQLTTTNTHIYQTFRQKQHNNNHPILEQKLQHQRKRNKRMIIIHLDETTNTTMGNDKISSNRTEGESSINITSNENITMMMISDVKKSSITPMGTVLILMSVTTILTIILTYTLVIYITEKRLFTERQIAMQLIPIE